MNRKGLSSPSFGQARLFPRERKAEVAEVERHTGRAFFGHGGAPAAGAGDSSSGESEATAEADEGTPPLLASASGSWLGMGRGA